MRQEDNENDEITIDRRAMTKIFPFFLQNVEDFLQIVSRTFML